MAKTEWKVSDSDRDVLRRLAERQAAIAAELIMDERRRLWTKQKSLASERPMVLLESVGVVDEFLPESSLQCVEPWARDVERQLRGRIYHYENVGDDTVVDPFIRCSWQLDLGGYGVPMAKERGIDAQGRSVGFRWQPAIQDLDSELPKLHHRTPSVDREATLAWKGHLEGIFAGIMPVELRGSVWPNWTMGMTMEAIFLVGLENFMLQMYDNPDGVHALMAFLRDDHRQLALWLETEGLLTLNNGNEYIGSGSYGFTADLPQPDWEPGNPVRLRDLWVLLESQETVGISPDMFAEFILPYQSDIGSLFGLTYYGCCEPVHNRWRHVKTLPNLRAVSVSPWCDEAFMAEALGPDYVYSRKPAPSLISTEVFDERTIENDLRHTLQTAAGTHLEIIMKDVHTLSGDPSRMGRWVQLARKNIDRHWR